MSDLDTRMDSVTESVAELRQRRLEAVIHLDAVSEVIEHLLGRAEGVYWMRVGESTMWMQVRWIRSWLSKRPVIQFSQGYVHLPATINARVFHIGPQDYTTASLLQWSEVLDDVFQSLSPGNAVVARV